MSYLFRILICILTLGTFLYVYVDKLNAHTELRLQIPALAKEVNQIKQDSIHLSYEIECFKNPQHLIQLAQQPEYSHLKFPYIDDILVVPTGLAKQHNFNEETYDMQEINRALKLPIHLGTK